MGSLERRVQQLEDLYNASGAGEEPGAHEEREREFLAKLQKAREKAEHEERMGDPRHLHALNKLEAFLKWRRDLSE